MSNIRPYFKKAWLANRQGGCCNDVLVVRPDGIDAKYLFAALSTDAFFDYVTKGAKGTKMPRGDKDHIMRYPILRFDNEQNIGSLIFNLNHRISLLQKQVKKLESIAQLIYDYWFTQFDFPDENGKPYRQSGGKMVYSKELKREIPDGWGVETLGDVCKIKLGGTPDTKNDAYWDGDIPWLSSAEIACNPVLSSEKYITEEGQKHSATEWSPSGSVALSITRYLRAAILGVDSCFNQSVVTLEENDLLKKEYLYPLVLSQIPRYLVLRTGAQQPHINKEVVAETIFVLPPMDVLNNYYKIVKPLYQKIITSAKKAKLLNELRDWLLPMLVNGQVKVS
ncbi:restriction endonuclease subunit S [Bifidobacterium magnum]|uniref:restriction endonuclease subunit S n=1 Tax=Bifidobacterium magnum TaxID=1692 RepID=UPI000B22F58A|nr:restriction endonuclease subunit S [Bifidobacterium magnum]